MKMTSKEIGSWGVIEVSGTVDSVHTKTFIDTLAEYLNGDRCKNIIIDLNNTDFLSIGAIRYINQVSQGLEETGVGRMVIMAANDRIRRHIDIFVSWKSLKEISSYCEVIPLQMSNKLKAADSLLLAESIAPSPTVIETTEFSDQN